ncbi:urocanate hydratase [Microaerobacter geothermalis]|uniref:urocanate hydratase n=1 Tax=Microaerobacter geothermalis TaxID=674972 RepID=UPI001F4850E8|nr:urocanate hydratase [Microaerobacter geothermalis]MCF6093780.1 urocanate hydratase [Microaerobacter geothermalis]
MRNLIHLPSEDLRCKNWQIEGIMRMLINTIDSDVAEDPDQLIVYGTGKAARNQEAVRKIIEELEQLNEDETLLIQSGKPAVVFRTSENAPRVIAVNSVVVPAYANWKKFRQLEQKGLTMYGQSTASAWAYIGMQGILQGTYETFHEVAAQHFQGNLNGKWILTSGLGGMGSAQPIAIKMNGGVSLVVEVDPAKVERSIKYNVCDVATDSLDEALHDVKMAIRRQTPLSIALIGNASDVYQELLYRGNIPDVVTDQTSAHDLLNGYIPSDYTVQHAFRIRQQVPEMYLEDAKRTVVQHVKAMVEFQKRGAVVFDYGNNIRQQAYMAGLEEAFSFSNFIPAYIRHLQCEGYSPFRWIALSGNPNDIYKIDQFILNRLSGNDRIKRWIQFAQANVRFQGLPARICWLKAEDRIFLAEKVNEMVASKMIQAPVVFTRDHMDAGSMASPLRETEGMRDGSDVIGDWPILNALLNTANGATFVSFHHGGGVGIGYSLHAGMSIVADGSKQMTEKFHQVFLGDVGLGIVRYADAGYDIAQKKAEELGIDIKHQ